MTKNIKVSNKPLKIFDTSLTKKVIVQNLSNREIFLTDENSEKTGIKIPPGSVWGDLVTGNNKLFLFNKNKQKSDAVVMILNYR